MGFNKRFFSKNNIVIMAKAKTYEEFKTYMLKTDAAIFESDGSSEIWESFSKGNEDQRKEIYQNLQK